MNEAPYEVDTDRGDVGLGVSVVGETQEQTRLSDTRVTNKQQLEQVVVSASRRIAVSIGSKIIGSKDGCGIGASSALSDPDSVVEDARPVNQNLALGIIQGLLGLRGRHGG